MSLFKECTKYVVKSAGSETLHHVTDLNSAEYFDTFCLVKRKKSFWFWKKDKNIPTQVKLDDVLLEKINIDDMKFKTKVLLEKFIETPTFTAQGDVGAKIASELNLDLKGTDDLKISLDLGNIVKTKVNWEVLEEQLQKVVVDIEHPLFNEVKQYKRTNLAVVLETLMTQDEANVKEDADTFVSNYDSLPVSIKKTSISVDVHARGSIESKTVHSFTLPSKTMLAYSCNVFTIGDDNKIKLHTSVDALDEDSDIHVISTKEQSAQGTDKVKAEFTLLLKDEKFNQLREKFKLIIGSITKETFQHLHMLLSLAEASIENEIQDNAVTLSSIDPSLKTFEEPCMGFLKLLDFVLPLDVHEANAKIILPKFDNNKLLTQCMLFIDCADDIAESALKILERLSIDELKVLLSVAENEISGIDTLLKDTNLKKFVTEGLTAQFLKNIGFVQMAMDDIEVISYSNDNRNTLFDIFAVLYVLTN